MYYISREEAISRDPAEAICTISKERGKIAIVADIEENLNLDDGDYNLPYPNDFRVEYYHDGDWTLGRELVLDPSASAVGEQRGCVAGGIEFYYEAREDWEYYATPYDCLFDLLPYSHDEVAVIEDLSELYDLDDGVWHVIIDGYPEVTL